MFPLSQTWPHTGPGSKNKISISIKTWFFKETFINRIKLQQHQIHDVFCEYLLILLKKSELHQCLAHQLALHSVNRITALYLSLDCINHTHSLWPHHGTSTCVRHHQTEDQKNNPGPGATLKSFFLFGWTNMKYVVSSWLIRRAMCLHHVIRSWGLIKGRMVMTAQIRKTKITSKNEKKKTVSSRLI